MLTSITFLSFFLLGCLMSIIRHPIYGLATYVGLVYVHPPSTWWGTLIPSLRWSLIAAVVTLISVFIKNGGKEGVQIKTNPFVWGMGAFILWILIQSLWALDSRMHQELIVLMIKYLVLVVLITKCIDSKFHLKVFLWSHAAGCFYLGTIVLRKYIGGRFEGFLGPGINEANAAALTIVTGIIVTFVLFLAGRFYEKIAAFLAMPITLNGLVATISRSGFLALAVSGALFNLLAPKKYVKLVRISSLAGLALLILITNPVYWERISTVLLAGEEVEGVDTGSRRLVLIEKQFDMFKAHPMGCGHRCTAVLSPNYLSDRYLVGVGDNKARSSHNTFMSLLVEQGIFGAMFYILLLIWVARQVFRMRQCMRESDDLVSLTYTATVAVLGAITVGDLFVDYLKFEIRFWFIGLLIVLPRLYDLDSSIKKVRNGRIQA